MSDLTATELFVRGTQRPRLTAVNCRVRPGELHVLIGANGAGKSTLLASLAGLQPLDGGRVQLDGLIEELEPALEPICQVGDSLGGLNFAGGPGLWHKGQQTVQ